MTPKCPYRIQNTLLLKKGTYWPPIVNRAKPQKTTFFSLFLWSRMCTTLLFEWPPKLYTDMHWYGHQQRAKYNEHSVSWQIHHYLLLCQWKARNNKSKNIISKLNCFWDQFSASCFKHSHILQSTLVRILIHWTDSICTHNNVWTIL